MASNDPETYDGMEHTGVHVLDPYAYAEAFEAKRPVIIPRDADLRGRILRGRTPEDFESLALDNRRLVFIMGPDGLSQLPGRPLRHALADIGLMPDYVQARIHQGYQFKLLVFSGGDAAPLATWDNTLDLVAACYPELGADIDAHRQTLKQTPFAHFAAQLPENMDMIDAAGEAHPLYMSLESYLAIPEHIRRQDALALRRVLLHEVHLQPLFSGDGHTLTPEGEKGLAEYLAPNTPTAHIEHTVMIDLSLGESQ
jgi:hypothetical protein